MTEKSNCFEESNIEGVVSGLMKSIDAIQCQCETQNDDSWERLAQDLMLNVDNFGKMAEANPCKGISFGEVSSILYHYARRACNLCEKRIKVKC